MSLVTLAGIVFAPFIVHALTQGWTPEKLADVTEHTRIMFPFILLVSLAALVMGMLNARNVFGMPAMASSFFNLGSIVGGAGIGYWLDPHFGIRAVTGLSIGTLIGGLLQLVVQFPSLARVGFRFRPDFAWRDEGVRQILVLMGPAVIAASAVQVNVMVNSNFCSYIAKDGPMTWLSYAFRLMQLPLGMFGVALGTVTLPLVSRFAANHDLPGVRSTLAHGIRLAFLLTVPCAIGLICLARPIISLIFQRGKFDFDATVQTAAALQFYGIGLVAYSGIKVIAPAFYALNKRNLPMMVSFFSILTNYLLNQFFTFHLHFNHRGLALSTSLVALINFGILYGMMIRQTGGLETPALLRNMGKLTIAGIPMALVCVGANHWIFGNLAHMAFIPKAVGVLGTIGVAAAVFGGLVAMLRIEEVDDVIRMAKRKFGAHR
jgi:putative peptidoglycan lipid II flippase